MKVALISDVHGNLVALNSILRSIDKESPDQIVSLGDVAATGPNPRECIETLKERNPLCVMGNTDEWLLNPPSRMKATGDMKIVEDVDRWCSQQLSEKERAFLRTFEPTIELDLGEGSGLLAFHGSPKSNLEWIDSRISERKLQLILSGRNATVMAGGHSHRQMMRRFRETLLINPGSVGLPFERHRSTGKLRIPSWSEYAVISRERSELTVSFRRVSIDLKDLSKSVLSSEMPHREVFLERWTSFIENMIVRNNLT